MKRYLLFSGDLYYPCGGWHDFKGDFKTIKEAEKKADEEGDDWTQIIDINTKQKVTTEFPEWE